MKSIIVRKSSLCLQASLGVTHHRTAIFSYRLISLTSPIYWIKIGRDYNLTAPIDSKSILGPTNTVSTFESSKFWSVCQLDIYKSSYWKWISLEVSQLSHKLAGFSYKISQLSKGLLSSNFPGCRYTVHHQLQQSTATSDISFSTREALQIICHLFETKTAWFDNNFGSCLDARSCDHLLCHQRGKLWSWQQQKMLNFVPICNLSKNGVLLSTRLGWQIAQITSIWFWSLLGTLVGKALKVLFESSVSSLVLGAIWFAIGLSIRRLIGYTRTLTVCAT